MHSREKFLIKWSNSNQKKGRSLKKRNIVKSKYSLQMHPSYRIYDLSTIYREKEKRMAEERLKKVNEEQE
jgi:hypothetical protein